MRKSVICVMLMACVLAAPSCKKDESSTTTPSLSGLALETAVPYVAVGSSLTLRLSTKGILTSDSSDPGDIGLSWQVNEEKRDTLDKGVMEFTYTVKEVGSYTVTCYAFANGYYSSSATTTFECINPATAITGVNTASTVTIGGKQWTAHNLYNTESGTHYKKAEVVAPLFGKLYTWEEASTACPAGWHLPTAEEWDVLGTDAYSLMAPAQFIGEDMWASALGQDITNVKNFNAIPVGYLDTTASVDQFCRFGEYAAFWTATPSAENADWAQTRYFIYNNATVQKGEGDKSSLALSVRCVKD